MHNEPKDVALRDTQELQRTGSPTLDAIARAASDPTVDVVKLEALIRLQREFEGREAERLFNLAMHKCQSEIDPIFRNKKGENSKYAELEFIDLKLRPIVARHGFSLTFDSPDLKDKDVTVTCSVLHVAGHQKKYSLAGQLDTAGPKGAATKTPIQGLGSTISYLRRYLIAMIFNLVFTGEDNDGAARGFIDERQVNAIVDMFTACEMDLASQSRFLEVVSQKTGARVESINEIPKKHYQDCMALLQQKLRQKGQGR